MSQLGLKAFAHLTTLACVTVTFIAGTQAADSFRYVSTNGNNTNPCTLALPCRSLQSAINKTPTDGEVHILESGFYGNNATISRSMTVVGNGHTVTLGAPVTINGVGAIVALRRVVLNGEKTRADGIEIAAASEVHIVGCEVYNFLERGIFQHGANTLLFVSDSFGRDNRTGLFVDGTATTAKVVVDRARFESHRGGGAGINIQGNVDAVITRTTVAHNNFHGIAINGARATVVRTTAANNGNTNYFVLNGGQLTLESSDAHGSSHGLLVDGGSVARISNSTFVNNSDGIRIINGSVLTRKNNTVSGNTFKDVDGTLTSLGAL